MMLCPQCGGYIPDMGGHRCARQARRVDPNFLPDSFRVDNRTERALALLLSLNLTGDGYEIQKGVEDAIRILKGTL